MTFDLPNCPQCSTLASHILETLYCHTPIAFATNNQADWCTDRGTEVLWDTSNIVRDEPKSLVTLHCHACGKSWSTSMEDSP